MPRKPPARAASKPFVSGAKLATHRFPDSSTAQPTWSGAPIQRSTGRWSGTVDSGGKKHHVGTFDTPRQFAEARDVLLKELSDARTTKRARSSELDGKTVAEFVGPAGEAWPWLFKRNGKRAKNSTFEHHEQSIRRFVAQFGDRALMGGVSRLEAITFVDAATENQVTSTIAMYNDAKFVDPSIVNPFEGMSRDRTRGRDNLPFVLTADEVADLRRVAEDTSPGEYGLVLSAFIEVMATSGARPGELRALKWSRLDLESGRMEIEETVTKHGGLDTPKSGLTRVAVLALSALEALRTMPRLSGEFVFPSRRGDIFTQSNQSNNWKPISFAFAASRARDHWLVERMARQKALRLAEPDLEKRARIPDGRLDVYELKHRAITYMGTPAPDGLGLSSADIAIQVGHQDGGQLVEKTYMHRNSDDALNRIQAAMTAGTDR